jgi:hypothetical protein
MGGASTHVERAAPPPEPAMAEPIDNRLIDEVLKDVQTRLARLEGMRDEMRRLRVLAGAHGDPARRRGIARLLELERDMHPGQTPPATHRPCRFVLKLPIVVLTRGSTSLDASADGATSR